MTYEEAVENLVYIFTTDDGELNVTDYARSILYEYDVQNIARFDVSIEEFAWDVLKKAEQSAKER